MGSSEARNSEREVPLREHLEELGRRLRVVIYSLVVSTIAIMALPANPNFLSDPLSFYDPLVSVVLKRIASDLRPPQLLLIGYELGAPIEIYVISSLLLAVGINIPIIGYQIYQFVNPALYEHERRAVYPFVISFTALFVTGAAFGYMVLAPFVIWAMLPFFAAVGAQTVISVVDFYSVIFVTVLMSGMTFTFPVFLVLLVRFGVIGTQTITKNRRYIYLAVFLVTALITPDGGPIADAALFIPIILLLEIAIIIAKRYEKEGVPPKRTWFAPEMQCRYCGAEMNAGMTFCWRCGKSQH